MDVEMGSATVRRRAAADPSQSEEGALLNDPATNKKTDDNESEKARRAPASSAQTITALMASSGSSVSKSIGVSAALLILIVLLWLSRRYLSKLSFLRVVTLLPVAACLWSAVVSNSIWRQRLLPLTVVATTVFAQLPTFVGSAFAAACIVLLSLSTLPSQRDAHSSSRHNKRNKSPLPVFLSIVLLVTILLTENFMVWVVSATFPAGQQRHTAPPPLQDNGRTVLQFLTRGLTKFQVVGGLRRLWNVQGALVACLGTSFVLADVYGRRNLYRLSTRAVLTLAAARTIRTISFLATVLPSQNLSCYAQRYPYPPPDDWSDWIWVGVIPAANGGCNDLIISGHATVTSTLACVSASVSDDALFAVALWSMVVFDYMVEIYEGFHYSVDMWLGMVLVCLLWRVLEPVERGAATTQPLEKKENDKGDDPVDEELLSRNMRLVVYPAFAIVAFLQLVLLPQWTANFLIVLYTCITAMLYVFLLQNKDPALSASIQHLGQHVLYCLLFMALGVYL